jgi:hypothetical protein
MVEKMARPGRFELPTLCLEGRRSVQLSYGRSACIDFKSFIAKMNMIDSKAVCPRPPKQTLTAKGTTAIACNPKVPECLQVLFEFRLSRVYEPLEQFGTLGSIDAYTQAFSLSIPFSPQLADNFTGESPRTVRILFFKAFLLALSVLRPTQSLRPPLNARPCRVVRAA